LKEIALLLEGKYFGETCQFVMDFDDTNEAGRLVVEKIRGKIAVAE